MRSLNWKKASGAVSLDTILTLILLVFFATLPLYIQFENLDFFKAYFPAGEQVLASGSFSYTYEGFDREPYEGFKNPPIVSLLMVPFALLEKTQAGIAFLVSEILVYLAAFLIFPRHFTPNIKDKIVLFLLFLFSKQFITSLDLGQLTPAAFLLLLLMIAWHLKDNDVAAGVCLGLMVMIKILLGIFFPYFLAKRRFVLFFCAVASFALITAASVLIFGLPLHLEYVETALLFNKGTTVLAHNNQNLFAFVMRSLNPPALRRWEPTAIPP